MRICMGINRETGSPGIREATPSAEFVAPGGGWACTCPQKKLPDPEPGDGRGIDVVPGALSPPSPAPGYRH
jgi:hypothetical protein